MSRVNDVTGIDGFAVRSLAIGGAAYMGALSDEQLRVAYDELPAHYERALADLREVYGRRGAGDARERMRHATMAIAGVNAEIARRWRGTVVH